MSMRQKAILAALTGLSADSALDQNESAKIAIRTADELEKILDDRAGDPEGDAVPAYDPNLRAVVFAGDVDLWHVNELIKAGRFD